MIGSRALEARAEDCFERLALAMAAENAPSPLRREIERFKEPCKEPGIRDAHGKVVRLSSLRNGFKRKGQDFGVCRLPVGAAETFDAGLDEFAGPPRTVAKHRPAIGKARAYPGLRRGEIMPADRNRIFRPQAIFSSRDIARQIELAANILARIEKNRGRLQDRGFAALIARRDQIGRDRLLQRAIIDKRQGPVGQTIPRSQSLEFSPLFSKQAPAGRQVLPEKVNGALKRAASKPPAPPRRALPQAPQIAPLRAVPHNPRGPWSKPRVRRQAQDRES